MRTSEPRSGSSALAAAAAQRDQACERERLPEDRGVLHDGTLVGREVVDARRDQRVQGLRHLERPDRARDRVPVSLRLEQAPVEQHAHRLDRVQGNALRTLEDLAHELVGQPRHEPAHQLAHRPVGERVERERRRVSAGAPPPRPPLRDLRPGQSEHEDRMRPRPVEEVLDEVEEARIGPLQIFEDERDRPAVGEPLEEEPPGGEEILPVERSLLAERQQVREPGLDPRPLGFVGIASAQHCEQLRQRLPAPARPRRCARASAASPRAPSTRRRRRRRGSGRGATRPPPPVRRGTSRTPTRAATCRSPRSRRR